MLFKFMELFKKKNDKKKGKSLFSVIWSCSTSCGECWIEREVYFNITFTLSMASVPANDEHIHIQ